MIKCFTILESHPTRPFTILEHQNPWIGEFYVVQERRTTDFKALKLGKGWSTVFTWIKIVGRRISSFFISPEYKRAFFADQIPNTKPSPIWTLRAYDNIEMPALLE